MSSSPDKTDARSMSDILASIRKIMAQDPPSGAPAAVKPPTNGVDGAPRAEMRLPSLEAPRDTAVREPAQPAAPAPAPQSSTAAAASTSSASKPVSGPAPRAPAADEPVSLDEFLAMAAPSRDVVTTPIVPSPPMAPAKPIVSSASTPAASAATPSDISTPDWLFPRARPIDENKGDASREPAFGTAPAGRPGNDAHGPSLVSPQAAGSGMSGPKPEAPPSKAPIAGAAVPTGQPPMGARDTESGSCPLCATAAKDAGRSRQRRARSFRQPRRRDGSAHRRTVRRCQRPLFAGWGPGGGADAGRAVAG